MSVPTDRKLNGGKSTGGTKVHMVKLLQIQFHLMMLVLLLRRWSIFVAIHINVLLKS